MDKGDEWDDIAEAHDIEVADIRNYVFGNHPLLPGMTRPKLSEFTHRPEGCQCIAAKYGREEYVNLERARLRQRREIGFDPLQEHPKWKRTWLKRIFAWPRYVRCLFVWRLKSWWVR